MKTSKKALKLALALTFGVVVLPSVAAAANDPNSGGFVEEISAGGSTYYHYYAGDETNKTKTASKGDVVITGQLWYNNQSKDIYNVYGGFSERDRAVNNNTVTINPASALIINGYIYGGYSSGSGDASKNAVSISDGAFKQNIYGGLSASGSVSENTVSIRDGAFEKEIYGGYSSGSGDASKNAVTIEKGTFDSFIYGGYSDSGSVSENKVNITDGTFKGNIYGGYSDSGSASENKVNITDATFKGEIYGGYSRGSGDASKNAVTIEKGTFNSFIYGGYIYSGSVSENKVNISDGDFKQTIYGGFSERGFVSENKVNISDGDFKQNIYGGYSSVSGDASKNAVTIEKGTFDSFIYGGYSYSGSASKNAVTIEKGTFDGFIYGGYSVSGSASENKVNISDGDFKQNIYGGYSSGSGDASKNAVTIEKGTFDSFIYGGYIVSGSASENKVNISGGTFTRDIYGGYSVSGSANSNMVSISGGDLAAASIYGSNLSTSTGNTLNWAYQATVKSVANFSNYNFYVSAGVQPNGNTALLTVTGGSATELGNATVKLVGIRGEKVWKVGNTVVLLANASGINDFGGKVSSKTSEGLRKYKYDLEQNSNQLLATITGVGIGDQAKSLSEARIAAIGFVNTAADLATGTALNNAMASGGKYDLFGAMNYSDSKYKSGSYADVKGSSFLLGFARNLDNSNGKWTVGGFIESGNSSYDTFNSFADVGDVRANGKNNYFGGGLMARNSQASGMYYEGSLRFGRMSTDYNSSDLDIKYDIKSSYYGLHLGLGKIITLKNKSELDLYGKYYWSHQNSATASIDGDNFNFDAINSHRLRLGARMNMPGGQGLKTYIGLAYEHEFSGNAGATYGIDKVAAPTIKGGTGIGEIGLVYKPTGKSAFSMDIGLNGYVGKRQGIGGGIKLNWGF